MSRVRTILRSLSMMSCALAGCFNPGGASETTGTTEVPATTTGPPPGTSTSTETPTTEGPPPAGTTTGGSTSTTTTGESTSTGPATTTELSATSTTTIDPSTTSTTTTGDESTTDPSTTSMTVPPNCGNGVVDVGEQCDDANDIEGDGCSTTCQQDAVFVFLSSGQYTGSFGGAMAADMICQALADEANLPGNYIAWVSDMGSNAVMRLQGSTNLPYILPNGTPLAMGTADFLDGELAAPIKVLENGLELNASMVDCAGEINNVWTGTTTNGQLVGPNCKNWTSVNMIETGVVGQYDVTTSGWTSACMRQCGQLLRLYCVGVTPG
jgi:cysteine-rich repeat protein